MRASWEKIENNKAVLSVEVEADRVAAALDKAFKKVVVQVNVPGFRKGKVPRSMFEARFGVEALYQDAIDILLPEVYLEAVKETGIEPVDRPEIDIDQFEKGQPFTFKATVTVKPEVKLGEYKGIEVPEQDTNVTAEDVEAELTRMQERHAELVVVEGDEAAQNGDTAIIDFEGFADGEAFEGGKGERHSLELGSGSFIPGFEEQVVGMKLGEDKDVNVTFPEEYHSEQLAGKPAVFKVKLHEIKRKNLPALDDEFAKDVSEFDTLEEYKNDIEQRLKKNKEDANRSLREQSVVEKAAEAADLDIPEAMIETEIDFMLQDFANQLRWQGMNLDTYYQFTGQSEQQLREQMTENAGKRVRQNLVLEAIGQAEQLTVSDEEIEEELTKLAERVQKSVDEVRVMLNTNGNMDGLRRDLMTRKTIELLLENCKTVSESA